MRKITPLFVAVAALGLAGGSSALAGTGVLDGFTITATNSQLETTYPGASTFADSTTFATYSGNLTTSVATITGGQLGGDTNPGSGIPGGGSVVNYPVATSGNPITITFNSNQKYFGLLWGSVDPSNTVTFYNGGTEVASFSGATLGATPIGLEGFPASGSFVDFVDNGGAFDKVVLSDNSEPFESVNYAAVVPEPAAWAMLILGMVGLGAVLRRRRDGAFAAA